MRMKEAMLLALMAQVVVAFGGVRQVFCQERFLRGDENVRAVQPIDSAAWIWEKAGETGEFDARSLADALCEAYEVDSARAIADVEALLKQWKELGIIE